MPRKARIREKGAIYHIISRSISDIQLFRDNKDKDKFIDLLSQTCKTYGCDILAFCLMDTHYHLMLDSVNVDVGTVMRSLNVAYATYYNCSYLAINGKRRRGPVFAGRYKSKIVNSERYLMVLSCYLHNNPKDIGDYDKKLEAYPYSSLRCYLNPKNNPFSFLNPMTILKCINANINIATKVYHKMFNRYAHVHVSAHEDIDQDAQFDAELKDYFDAFDSENGYDYHSGKVRRIVDIAPSALIEGFCQYFKLDQEVLLQSRYERKYIHYRAMLTVLLRSIGDLSLQSISTLYGHITMSQIYLLSRKGVHILEEQYNRSHLFQEIVQMAMG